MTDIHDLLIEYWPYVGVAAALLVVAILWLILGRSQRVELPPPTLEDNAPRATLTRPPPPAPSESLGVPPPPEPVAVDLTRLKGVGPKLAATLATLGLTGVDQIAALDEAGSAAVDAQLGAFKGRLARDRIVEQAQLLATGDIAAYETQFGKLDPTVPSA